MSAPTTPRRTDIASNPYLAEYRARAAHQAAHDAEFHRLYDGQPNTHCMACLHARHDVPGRFDIKKRFSWAIPDDDALSMIAEFSPNGVVEIGAGGGYWAGMLRTRGVDVVAYDPDPAGDLHKWHDGTCWSEVLLGDHTSVIGHPDRTLLMVWPCYDESWTDQAVDLYGGDTVIYVGEGRGGCTGTDRMHALLGESGYCWHDGGEACDCPVEPEPRFEEVAEVGIPQWWGIHDRLHVYRRRSAA